jgi:hypothetical protein
MPEIVLTEEQARVLAEAETIVVVRNPSGATVGVLDPKEAAVIAEARRRLALPGPRYTGAQVLASLDALQTERDRIGPFDATYMREFLRQLEQADPTAYGPEEAT